MKTTAIICEYNPMTNGHVDHIAKAKEETKADTILCVMSGSFVQRGESAILDKYIRAEIAVKCGADVVVELPTIYAISPADNFAYGAIKTISTFPDVEYISFGSECGDAQKLEQIADFLSNENDEYKSILKDQLKLGLSFPKARSVALAEYSENHTETEGYSEILDKPNNILGIAYISQIKKLGLPIKIHTIKRDDNYNSDDINSTLPSSSAVRKAIVEGKHEELYNSVPSISFDYLIHANSNISSLGDMILFKMKTINGFELETYYDVSGGINNRLKLAANDSTTYEEMLEKAKTKNYTMARLKRICLYTLFDITKTMYQESLSAPSYIQLLALRKERKDILSALSSTCQNVLTKYSDISKVDKSLRQMLKLDFAAQGTLSIINRSGTPCKKMLLI